MVLILAGCASSQSGKELKLGHGLDVSHPVHKALVFFSERLEEKSGGQLKVEIYPSNQLGSERELLELLQVGSVTMTKVSVAVMENFVSDYKVFGLPYLFESKDHMFRVVDSQIGKGILNKGREYRLLGLAFYDAGSRSFYTKERPIHSPEDLEGMKIRVMKSNTAMKMVESLGGSPAPISSGELYSALQQGVVDGAENNPPTFYSSKHYEICKYFSLDEHASIPDVILMSTVWWDRLSDQEKKWVQEAANESVIYQREIWAESEKTSLEAVKKEGVEVNIPDKKPFNEKALPVYSTFREDPRLNELIDQILNMKSL